MVCIKMFFALLRFCFQSRADLVLENIALRQQLCIYSRRVKKPGITNRDRWFWIALYRFWSDWKWTIIIAKPETVIRWHRNGFRAYWKWKSRKRGRPRLEIHLLQLIQTLSGENLLWGLRRIQAELELLGKWASLNSISKYRKKKPGPSSQNWKSFLKNHLGEMISIDLFTLPTLAFKQLQVLVILDHERRKILSMSVSFHPTGHWMAQQILNSFSFTQLPKFLLRDRDGRFEATFTERIQAWGMKEILTTARSPWQNDYNLVRPHQSLEQNAPIPREVMAEGRVVSFPYLSGLHHLYKRKA